MDKAIGAQGAFTESAGHSHWLHGPGQGTELPHVQNEDYPAEDRIGLAELCRSFDHSNPVSILWLNYKSDLKVRSYGVGLNLHKAWLRKCFSNLMCCLGGQLTKPSSILGLLGEGPTGAREQDTTLKLTGFMQNVE